MIYYESILTNAIKEINEGKITLIICFNMSTTADSKSNKELTPVFFKSILANAIKGIIAG